MKIDNAYIASLIPCTNRHDNYLSFYKGTEFTVVEFLKLENISYNDKIWVWRKFATINEAALFGLACADSVLHIFESRRPGDLRPRQALEAARIAIAEPTDENKKLARSAAATATTAADAYTDAYAFESAAYVTAIVYAADAAAYAAVYAADAVAYAAVYADVAADAADVAVDAAVDAADAAVDAASSTSARAAAAILVQRDKNLKMLIEIYERSSI